MAGLYELADEHRRAVLAGERTAAAAMVDAYKTAESAIVQRLDLLTAQIAAARDAGERPSVAWLFSQGRLQQLQQQTEAEITYFARLAEQRIRQEQATVVQQAPEHAQQLAQAALGPPPPQVVLTWARVPAEALTHLVGTLTDGSPLRVLLDELGPAASQAVRDSLIRGLVTGVGPKVVAREIRDALGSNLVRALTVSRTEILRSYRSAAHESFRANSDVVRGWVWRASHSNRTCAACWAMSGTFHRLDERLNGHPRCRCVAVPSVRSWAELGYSGMPAPPKPPPSGVERFARLSEADQLKILGPAKLAAYQAGAITLPDLVAVRHSRRWGATRVEASLREVLGDAAAQYRKAA